MEKLCTLRVHGADFQIFEAKREEESMTVVSRRVPGRVSRRALIFLDSVTVISSSSSCTTQIMSTTTTDFFPKIGDIAAETDAGNEDQEDGDKLVQEIESLCMKCQEQGMTRMMLTTIPYFRQVIVMSFNCEHCGTSNNEVQSAGEIRSESAHTKLVNVNKLTERNVSLQLREHCTPYTSPIRRTYPGSSSDPQAARYTSLL